MPFTQHGTCDVCSREREIGIACLPFAPMSVAFCKECLIQRAYPLWSIHAMFDMCDGPANVAEWMHACKAFKDGEYLDWAAIVACYTPQPLEPGDIEY